LDEERIGEIPTAQIAKESSLQIKVL